MYEQLAPARETLQEHVEREFLQRSTSSTRYPTNVVSPEDTSLKTMETKIPTIADPVRINVEPKLGLYATPSNIWQHPRAHKVAPLFLSYPSAIQYLNRDPSENPPGTTMVNPDGTITLIANCGIRIDLTIDGGVRLFNFQRKCILARSAGGPAVAMIHPNGRIVQWNNVVDMVVPCINYTTYAKMWRHGISYQSDRDRNVYFTNNEGTRSGSSPLLDLREDFSLDVFRQGSRTGPGLVPQMMAINQDSTYWVSDGDLHNWGINNIWITECPSGIVKVTDMEHNFLMRSNTFNASSTVISSRLFCSASQGVCPHIFAKHQSFHRQRMHCDGQVFVVRHNTKHAGFNELGNFTEF